MMTSTPTKPASPSTCSNTSNSSIESGLRSPSPVDPNWIHKYEIPWGKFSKRDLLCVIQKGLRPTTKARNKMIAQIVEDIMVIKYKPGRKALEVVARKIWGKYPSSFSDEIEGDIVGTGYSSLVTQLVTKCENERRNTPTKPTVTKRLSSQDGNQDGTKRKRQEADSYGCVNFSPDCLPEGETAETLEENMKTMQKMFSEGSANGDEVRLLMKQTYVNQRQDILNGMDARSLKEAWPYLFEVKGMFVHFHELTGVDIRFEMESTFPKKSSRILAWMHGQLNNRSLRQIEMDLEKACLQMENKTPEAPATIMAVMAEFHEEEEALFRTVQVRVHGTSHVYCALPHRIGAHLSTLCLYVRCAYIRSLAHVLILDHK
jgi:hypothetical protein